MFRIILALALASSVWAETICTCEPTICDGSYNGTTLCACPARRVPPANAGRRRVVATCLQRGWESGTRRGRRAASRWGGGVGASGRGGAHRASAARRGSDAPTGTPLHPSYCSRALSQEPSQQGPDQRRRRPQPHGGAAVSVAGALAAAASDTATAAAVTPPATAGVGNEDSPLEHTPRTKLTRAHR